MTFDTFWKTNVETTANRLAYIIRTLKEEI